MISYMISYNILDIMYHDIIMSYPFDNTRVAQGMGVTDIIYDIIAFYDLSMLSYIILYMILPSYT
jgi:hypothetical protein